MTANEQQALMVLVDNYALASYQQGTLVGVGNRPDKVEASIKRTAERRAAVEAAARPLTAATSAPEPVGEREAFHVIKKCCDALAEELSAWDIDPPLHHVAEAHDLCEQWLAARATKDTQ